MASAQGNIVDDLLKGLGLGGSTGGGGAATPAAGAPPTYTPPLHGTNPHGQGSTGVVDILPSDTLPLPANPSDGDEDVTVGDSRGEENAGSYAGRVSAVHLNLLDAIDTEELFPGLFTIKTVEGETKSGPLQPVQDAVNSILCPLLSSPADCVQILEMNSSTNGSGSTNSFTTAGTNIGVPLPVPGLGSLGLTTGVATSDGNISDDGTCQTATGESTVANANVGLPLLPVINAGALEASSESRACNNGTPSSVNNSSTVLGLQGTGIPLPAAGCDNGTPNTNFDVLAPIVATVCNADTTNAGQTSAPYGVREALTAFVLIPLLKATTAGPESHAVAPAATTPPTTTPPDDNGGGGNQGNQGGGNEGGAGNPGGGPTSTVAQPGGDELAFTGANLLVLGLLGGGLILGGVGLARASTRRHQRLTA